MTQKEKTIVFFEVNNDPEVSRCVFANFPPDQQARLVFDVINNLGAATLRMLNYELHPDLNATEINNALGLLLNSRVITRRTLTAHPTD